MLGTPVHQMEQFGKFKRLKCFCLKKLCKNMVSLANLGLKGVFSNLLIGVGMANYS